MGPAAAGGRRTPDLRRRRLGGSSGNPNEPDEEAQQQQQQQQQHEIGGGGGIGGVTASAAGAVPLHHGGGGGHLPGVFDAARLPAEERRGGDENENDAGGEERKIHGSGANSSLPLFLQRTFFGPPNSGSRSRSLGRAPVASPCRTSIGGRCDDGALPASSPPPPHRHQRQHKNENEREREPLNELDALIERRDWAGVAARLRLARGGGGGGDGDDGGDLDVDPKNSNRHPDALPASSATAAHNSHDASPASSASASSAASVPSTTSTYYSSHYRTTLLPLHRACMIESDRPPPPRTIFQIVSSFPHAVTVRETAFGRLPLHLACRSGAGIGTIRVLLRGVLGGEEGGGVRVRDDLGRLPLHYCVGNGGSVSVVRALVDAYNNGDRYDRDRGGHGRGGRDGDGDDDAYGRRSSCLTVPDAEGWLPLHVACGVGASRPVVRALVRAEPRALTVRTRRGSTPLDCARLFVGGSYADGISALFERTTDERRVGVVMEEEEEEEEEEDGDGDDEEEEEEEERKKEEDEEGAWMEATLEEDWQTKGESSLRPRSRFEHRRKRGGASARGSGYDAGWP